jgi:hypothetical protein
MDSLHFISNGEDPIPHTIILFKILNDVIVYTLLDP